jgi:hypothetical protein
MSFYQPQHMQQPMRRSYEPPSQAQAQGCVPTRPRRARTRCSLAAPADGTRACGMAARAGVGLLFMTTQDQPPQVPVPPFRAARPLACTPRVRLRKRQTTRASPGMADVNDAGTWQIVVKEVVQGGSAWRSGMVGFCCLARPITAELPLAVDRRPSSGSCASGLPTGPCAGI